MSEAIARARGSGTALALSRAVLPLRDLRLLFVEDHSDVRELFATLLAAAGAQVAQASSGREALTAASTRRFDAILTDLGLPDIDGDVLIGHLLGGAARPCPTVAVMTGHGEAHVARARAAGARAVFQKPVEWQHVLTFLRGLTPRGEAAAAGALPGDGSGPAAGG